MTRQMPAQGALEAFALYFESPQVWLENESAKANPNSRFQVAWDRIGSRDIPLLFRRDGFLIFRFDRSPAYAGGAVPAYDIVPGERVAPKIRRAEDARTKLAYRRIEYMNAFLLALTSAVSTVHSMGSSVQRPVDPLNHLRAHPDGAVWRVTTPNTRHNLPYDVNRPLVMKVEAFEDAIGVMRACDDAFGDGATLLLSMIYTACHQYGQHQFASAHMIGWCVVESLINMFWAKLIDEVALDKTTGTGHTEISSKRRELLNGRDYTASIITQILSISRKIDDDLLVRLDQARKVRNEFAHSLKPISPDDSGKVVRLAADLLTQLCGRRVTGQLSYGAYV